MTAKIISVVNHKGGVGKTTTVVNLGAGLARLSSDGDKKNKILVLDMDPQSNSTMTLIPKELDYSKIKHISDVFEGAPLAQAIVPSTVKNLDFVSGHINLFEIEQKIINSVKAIEGLRSALRNNPILETYDYILIDCPPNLGSFMLNSLVASHYYIIPIESESFYALQGMNILESKIKEVKEVANNKLSLLGYLVTMYDARTTTGRAMFDQIQKVYSDNLFKTTIRRNTDINKATSLNQTIFQLDLRVPGSRDYYNLAKEVIKRIAALEGLKEPIITTDEELENEQA